jgi:cytochrome c oxidase cbb3-type subunit 3
MNTKAQYTNRKVLGMAALSLLPFISMAAEQQEVETISYFSNALFNTLLVVIILLAIMVAALSKALRNIVSSDLFLEKVKRDKDRAAARTGKVAGLVILFSMMGYSAMAQAPEATAEVVRRIGGIDYFTFYLMSTIIFLEVITLLILFNTFKNILGYEAMKAEAAAKPAVKTKTLFEKMNYTVDIEDEGTIMLDHDYDGIKELDNNLPPWWKWGFVLTIIVAVIYIVNYHITKSSPLQGEEYTLSVKKAEVEIAEYMKTSANNVDENSVKQLTEASDLAAGKDIFITTCAACHGRAGEGGVGPNMTDDYWIHGGGVKDIFKTIKYGWPDKGMKSWKDDYSPIQIAQLTSFIRTLRGTNPANPKEKQGELYMENAMPSDSTAVKADSTAVSVDSLKVAAHK